MVNKAAAFPAFTDLPLLKNLESPFY